MGTRLSLVNRAVVEEIGVGIVAVDFQYFGDVPPSRPALNLDHDMKRVGDVALDSSIREFDTALQDATGEPSKPLLCGIRVQRG